MRLIELDSTGSTNAEARKLADAADFGPLWIRADEQTAGRGRRGRNWVSPKGNLYCTALFQSELPVSQIGLYSFVAALAVYDSLKAMCPDAGLGLKWPNDALLNEAKISGLLLETGKTHHQNWVIVGIGINLVSHPENTPYPATNLTEHIDDVLAPDQLVSILMEKFASWKHIFENKGFDPIRVAWRDAAVNVPGPVTVKLPNEEFVGTAIDMGQNGALQVQLPDGTMREVHAGDVYLG